MADCSIESTSEDLFSSMHKEGEEKIQEKGETSLQLLFSLPCPHCGWQHMVHYRFRHVGLVLSYPPQADPLQRRIKGQFQGEVERVEVNGTCIESGGYRCSLCKEVLL